MTKPIYGLSYCEDDGSSESWNWFYMPIELFESKDVREKRKAVLLAENENLEFEEWENYIITDAEKGEERPDTGTVGD